MQYMCSQQKATQMLRGNTIPGLWEKLFKYKCLAPAKCPGGGGRGRFGE